MQLLKLPIHDFSKDLHNGLGAAAEKPVEVAHPSNLRAPTDMDVPVLRRGVARVYLQQLLCAKEPARVLVAYSACGRV
ncbi:hypothetical protein NDU88_005766 [Pleurodeles waltl]|uniref:Uncharacterized protein n=1 Tax=Pleurodeles waltl TaxID=8319 RepID=A0AAV7WCD5_PLEWA|nr:hypothetical protein NDU88_005766 [Pleurodeles waltl]